MKKNESKAVLHFQAGEREGWLGAHEADREFDFVFEFLTFGVPCSELRILLALSYINKLRFSEACSCIQDLN